MTTDKTPDIRAESPAARAEIIGPPAVRAIAGGGAAGAEWARPTALAQTRLCCPSCC